MDEPMTLGDRLRQIRKDRLMTQEQLEARSGVSQGQISALEKGRQAPEGLGTGILFDLCKALDCNPVWLVTGAGTQELSSVDPKLHELIQAVSGLSESGMQALIATAKALKHQ